MTMPYSYCKYCNFHGQEQNENWNEECFNCIEDFGKLREIKEEIIIIQNKIKQRRKNNQIKNKIWELNLKIKQNE